MAQYKCKKCGWEGDIPEGKYRYCYPCKVRSVRRWESRNPEKRNKYRRNWQRRYREEHRLEYNAQKRKRITPERSKELWQRRMRWLLEGDVTREQLIDIYTQAKGECHYCGIQVKSPRYTTTDPRGFDHVKSMMNGGNHTVSNIVVCCRRCNAIKGGFERNGGKQNG